MSERYFNNKSYPPRKVPELKLVPYAKMVIDGKVVTLLKLERAAF